jgi:enamine deaminase RidA (YjgF/YER057c/UK114 family)
MDIKRINPTARWSDATVFNNMAHFVEIAEDTSADIIGQVQQILTQAEATLILVNRNKSRILSATIYVTDFAHLAALNAPWDS